MGLVSTACACANISQILTKVRITCIQSVAGLSLKACGSRRLASNTSQYLPKYIFFVLGFSSSLEGRVLRPHGEGDPSVIEYLLTHVRAPGWLWMHVGLRQGSITSSVTFQALVVCEGVCAWVCVCVGGCVCECECVCVSKVVKICIRG